MAQNPNPAPEGQTTPATGSKTGTATQNVTQTTTEQPAPAGGQVVQPPAPGEEQPAQAAPARAAEPTDEAKAVYEEEQRARLEDPNTVIVREANPEFGGESFGYGGQPA